MNNSDWQKAIDEMQTLLGNTETTKQTYALAIDAMRKEMQRIVLEDKYGDFCCPRCMYVLYTYSSNNLDEYMPHCMNCGQAILWPRKVIEANDARHKRDREGY